MKTAKKTAKKTVKKVSSKARAKSAVKRPSAKPAARSTPVPVNSRTSISVVEMGENSFVIAINGARNFFARE